VITFLLTIEMIPLCLRIMEAGSELSKTVGTFLIAIKHDVVGGSSLESQYRPWRIETSHRTPANWGEGVIS